MFAHGKRQRLPSFLTLLFFSGAGGELQNLSEISTIHNLSWQ